MAEFFTTVVSDTIVPREIDNASAEEIVENVNISEENPATVSSEDSVICLDEEVDDYSLRSLPNMLENIGGRSETVSTANNDDDCSIVYEGVVPHSEVRYVIHHNLPVYGTLYNRSNQIQNQPLQSDSMASDVEPLSPLYVDGTASWNSNVDPRSENRKPRPNTDSLDDSIHIVGEFNPTLPSACAMPKSIAESVELNNKAHIDSVERKKRKIECGVCNDGPDEISLKKCRLVSTSCGHIFCSACIQIVIQTSKQCPRCRKKLSEKKYHPLYI